VECKWKVALQVTGGGVHTWTTSAQLKVVKHFAAQLFLADTRGTFQGFLGKRWGGTRSPWPREEVINPIRQVKRIRGRKAWGTVNQRNMGCLWVAKESLRESEKDSASKDAVRGAKVATSYKPPPQSSHTGKGRERL